MKKQTLVILALVLTAFAAVSSMAQAPAKAPIAFNEKDRESAIKYMNDTKADYLGQLQGLSDAQLNFRAGKDRWTIAEIAEHITVVEEALMGMVSSGMFKPEPSKCDAPFRVQDGMVLGAVTNRSRKATAPEQVQPNGRWKTVPELTASFEKRRNASIDMMKTNTVDLRNRFGQSPFGMIDGFQQILFIIGHSERHLAQLKEVKADAAYPKK